MWVSYYEIMVNFVLMNGASSHIAGGCGAEPSAPCGGMRRLQATVNVVLAAT